MDKEIEEKIISSFIIDRKKDRAKFELWNDKKRRDFIRDVGNCEYIDNRFIKKITQPISANHIIYDILKKYGAPDDCYVLQAIGPLDGVIMPLKDALENVVYNGPALISCIHGKLAYIEGEVSICAPDRYLLIRDKK